MWISDLLMAACCVTESIPVHLSMDVQMIQCDTGAFTPDLHPFIRRALAVQSPRSHVNARWVCVCVRGSCRSRAWLTFNEAQHSADEVFLHKRLCISSSITHSARQSQIVTDKINAANRYE